MKLILTYFVIMLLYPISGSKKEEKKEDPFDRDLSDLQEELADVFRLNTFNVIDNGVMKEILDELNITKSDDRSFAVVDKTVCGMCKHLVGEIKSGRVTATTFAIGVCKMYVMLTTGILTHFCEDMAKVQLPALEYILSNSKSLDPELACSIMLQNHQCYHSKPELKWNLEAPSILSITTPEVNREGKLKPLKILFLSDLHITPDYAMGGVENCGYPICCKQGLGNPFWGTNAGVWGDYNCDVSPWFFGQTMLYLNQTYKELDFVYFTGDIIDHTVWKASIDDNSELINFTYKTLMETFPNIPILSVIGNHDSAPLNMFPPSEDGIEKAGLSVQWLYTLLSNLMSNWLPEDSLHTVKKQGYYSYTVNKKFKVVALNNNVCYYLNWWLMYNTTYLDEQLNFLSDELEQAERIGQFVHIITHIPVGNKECIEPWEVSYNNLIKRYPHIVKGQFYGHIHTDELKIFYNEDGKPINIGYNGGSLTPYAKYDPNYKLITVDPYSYDILDVETFSTNLTEANRYYNRVPKWPRFYSMKKAYSLKNLLPKTVNNVLTKLTKDKVLFNRYWRFHTRQMFPSVKDGCNDKCKNKLLCRLFTTDSMNSERAECTK